MFESLRPTAAHAVALAALLAAVPLTAQEGDAAPEGGAQDPGNSWSQFFQSLSPETGTVTVQGGKAEIDLPEGWHYLQQQSARRVVEDLWGNPPDPSTLGLLTPPRFESEDEGTPTWAIIVSYDDEGHVPDDDAADIDYADMLTTLQEGARAENPAREKQGYEAIEIVDWAEQPHYDATEKKLYWAKHLRFGRGAEAQEVLNYDIRILGRRGTLVLQAVAGMDELEDVRQGAKALLPHVDFVEGERYADYQEGVDPLVVGGDPYRRDTRRHGALPDMLDHRFAGDVGKLLSRQPACRHAGRNDDHL